MKLGMQVGHGPSRIVLVEDPAPLPKKGTQLPKFLTHVYFGHTARWINMPLGMEVGLSLCHIVLDGDPAPPPQKKGAQPHNFRPMYIVAKRLDGSRYHLVWRKASAQATLC